MEAANNATVKSSFYHPQHLLSYFQYSGTGSSIYACAACELRVIGTGYRCELCDFNIHESCFTKLPPSHSADDRHPHELTLTRLDASQRCDLCKETSHMGRYLYRCAPCNYAVHPRCTTLLDAQPQGERQHVNNGTLSFMLNCANVTLTGCKAVDFFFGDMLAPVIDPLKAAVDEMLQ
ncbi:hypothetical protein PR202_gb21604 [Eleusine coracana subsp. coracana]|uniref:Phorbol-ester/DAG-type domain-containing protein n=1 Tax=Eleusine coracana subsp. coracana TaxID=191504 RepID=A0AAV5FDI9_ELECO|nr:hypothetical protein QOZ80_7BG0608110 [Eleusine coracana subsp. coracana]GJN33047.1 hypothetical protein PR202_gb21604 [Eleusine coracana subsp. coracana]